MSKGYCVYKHTTPVGKVYIGITKQNPEYRWGRNGKGYSTCAAFWRAINKYGWGNITHEILIKGISESEAKQEEIRLIKLYESQEKSKGYNLTAGGDGMSNPSEETRIKLSLARKGRQPTLGYRHTEEAKLKISKASKGHKYGVGRVLTEDHKRKIGEASKGNKHNLGRKASAETREKLSEAHKGKVFTPEERAKIGKANSIAVNQYTLEGDYILTHVSAVSAARAFKGTRGSHISECCKGERLSWKGFQWRHDTGENRCYIGSVDVGIKEGDKHPSSVAVIGINKQDNTVVKFPCIQQAAKFINGWGQNISKCCRGELKSAHGYVWRYAESE